MLLRRPLRRSCQRDLPARQHWPAPSAQSRQRIPGRSWRRSWWPSSSAWWHQRRAHSHRAGSLPRKRRGGLDLHRFRSRLALELLPVTGHAQDCPDGIGRLRTNAEPVGDPLGVDLHVGGVLLWVVLADLLDRTAVALGARVGDDDAVVRLARLATPHELDLGGHVRGCSSSSGAAERASAGWVRDRDTSWTWSAAGRGPHGTFTCSFCQKGQTGRSALAAAQPRRRPSLLVYWR